SCPSPPGHGGRARARAIAASARSSRARRCCSRTPENRHVRALGGAADRSRAGSSDAGEIGYALVLPVTLALALAFTLALALARVVEAAAAVARQREAREDANHRGGRHGDQHADKPIERASGKEGKYHPDRVEVDAVAEELWRQDVGLGQLAHDKDPAHGQDRRERAELRGGEPDRQDETGGYANERDDPQNADQQAERDPRGETGKGQG